MCIITGNFCPKSFNADVYIMPPRFAPLKHGRLVLGKEKSGPIKFTFSEYVIYIDQVSLNILLDIDVFHIFVRAVIDLNMTHLGVYLSNISMSNGEISRRTGIWKSRLSDLRNKDSSNLKAEELYLISKVLDVDPKEILEEIYGHLELK